MALIDFHAHLAPHVAARTRLLEGMARDGIEQTVVVAGGLVSPQDLFRGVARATEVPNERVRELCDKAPDKLLPFFFANPHVSAQEYRRTGNRFYGLKLGPAVHGVALTDARHLPFLELARHWDHSVYLHCLPRLGFDVEALLQLARAFPTLHFVLGHAGIGNCDFAAVDAVAPFTNIYFELSGGFAGVVKYALSILGPHRLLFGSEYPLQEPALEIHKARLVGLQEESLNANARRLLHGRRHA